MKSNLVKFLIFALIATTPVVAYLFFKDRANYSYSKVPTKIWPIGLDSISGDSIYHKIENFVAINANGNSISSSNMMGKVSVVELFFTTCPSICPIMNKQMERVYTELGQNKNFNIYSYTIDVERDSLPVLKSYAKEHGADLNSWFFLRANNQEEIFNFGRNSLKLPVDEADVEDNFIHSERFVLIDWDMNIRGYYMGTDTSSVNEMINDIVLLLNKQARLNERK